MAVKKVEKWVVVNMINKDGMYEADFIAQGH